MAKLVGFPEYVGFWVQEVGFDILRYQSGYSSFGSFRMFIDEREPTEGSAERIRGRIKDKLGKSIFEGVISPEKVEFVKTYIPGHSSIKVCGVGRSSISYNGRLDSRVYHGQRHYEGEYEFTGLDGQVCRGVFLLEKYRPSRLLEFLMRMDCR